MTCQDREQDLLLLLHGELPRGRRLRLQAHLRRCSRCRQRMEKLSNVSYLIAGAVRTPDMPPWQALRSRMPLPRFRARYTLLLLMLALLAGLLGYTKSANSGQHHRAIPITKKTPAGCTPNLPNDHCR